MNRKRKEEWRDHKSCQKLQASGSRIWLGTPQIWCSDANYPTTTPNTYYHHEQQQQRYSLCSSASAVTEARIFPFTINHVQIECGPFSLPPGGYWAHSRGKISRSVKITIHPWFRLEMKNWSPPYACATRRARATTSPADKRSRKSTFRLTTM